MSSACRETEPAIADPSAQLLRLCDASSDGGEDDIDKQLPRLSDELWGSIGGGSNHCEPIEAKSEEPDKFLDTVFRWPCHPESIDEIVIEVLNVGGVTAGVAGAVVVLP